MKTYWDLSEKERAALEREDVTRFADAELMLKGVLKVKPPVDVEVPTVKLTTHAVVRVRVGYTDLSIAFASNEQAQAFLALDPSYIQHDYLGGESVDAVRPMRDVRDVTLQVEQLPAHADVEQRKQELIGAGEINTANKRARDAYEKALTEQAKALDGMWADWLVCRARERELRRVIDVFTDYVQTCSGDVTLAGTFLRKVFAAPTIADAVEWYGQTIPTSDEPVPVVPNNITPGADVVGEVPVAGCS